MNHKYLVLLAVLLLANLCIIPSKAAIKIGVAGPFTGPLQSYGIPTYRAAILVANELNTAGGINGETIEVISGDDACNPTQATTIANNLISSGVVVVLGHICSGATESALAVYTSANIPVMSPASTNRDLTYSGSYPSFFRTISPNNIQAEIQVKFLLNVFGIENYAFLHDGSTYGLDLVDSAKDYIEQPDRGQTVHYEQITSGLTDYEAPISGVIAAGADVLIYGGVDTDASKLLNELRSQGSDILFVSGDGVMTSAFLTAAGENAEGALISASPSFADVYLAYEAKQAHIDLYSEEPGPFFLNAYAAAKSLLTAIDIANSTNNVAIKNTLMSESFFTSIGNISFDSRGDVTNVGYSLYKVVSGEYVEIFTGFYTEAQLNTAKNIEVIKWDINKNNKVDLSDGIHVLKTVTGL